MTTSTGFRFRPEMHVRKPWEFRRAYRGGGRARGRFLSVVVVRNRLQHSRLGLSVSKKVGKAVRRNKIKRVIREAYRLSRWEVEARAGQVDIVVIPNGSEARFPLDELMRELPLLVEKASAKAGKRRRKPPRTGKRQR